MSLDDGLKLAVKVLKKSLDKNKMNPENVEIFVLEKKEGEMNQRFVKSDEIQKFIEIVDKEDEIEKEKEKKKKKDF
jgi:20S proteasome alpha/beta subunit